MQTKSIRLTREEARDLEELVEETGEVEAAVLKRAALRGIREERIERGVLAYLRGESTSRAAAIANLPRARFLDLLAEKGVTLLQGPSTLGEELSLLARWFGDARLEAVSGRLQESPGDLADEHP